MSVFFNLYFLSSDIFLLITSLNLLIFGVFLASNKVLGSPVLSKIFAILVYKTLFLSILILILQVPISAYFLNGLLFTNYFTYFANILLVIFSFNIASLSLPYLETQKIQFFEFWILLLFSVVAISFVIFSFDLLSVYISIELQSLIFYILASFNRTSEFSTEAGLKYFILGAFSSAFLLMGSAILYGLCGVTNLMDFSKLCSGLLLFDSNFAVGLTVGIIFFITSLLFKFNSAPFHFWSPDVYDGVPLPVTAIFAILPKIALAGLLIKIIFFAFSQQLILVKYFLFICCLLSSILGILGAFSQLKWKRFIAYSSIGHSSFILLALVSDDFLTIVNSFLFLIVYSVSSLLFFYIVTNLQFFQFPNKNFSRFITSIKSLSSINSILSFYLLILMFSFAGLPPFAGFFSKFFILLTSLKTNWVSLSITLILLNCLASFYYLRFSKMIYFDVKPTQLVLVPMTKSNSILSTLCVLFLIFLIFDLDFLLSVSKLITISLIK
uniref:NADH dehydrogenase subunit 2 n=1 Tax=Campylaephora kondoi TaxID=218449 RepID=UPI002E77FDD2|nr:NADH dehydrogenase subunit 2 [Campylaephora kondoi]WQF69473.1 NADH dehydrogenase subunit 2 [Campylaephora kondoi]